MHGPFRQRLCQLKNVRMVGQNNDLDAVAEVEQGTKGGVSPGVVRGLQDVVANERDGRRGGDVILDRREAERKIELVPRAF